MTNNEENYNYCKRVAKELEAYASGDYCRCNTCGEIFKEEEITEKEATITATNDQEYTTEEKICPECDAYLNSVDPLSLYDYFEDFLDVEYIIDSRGNYIGSKIYITLGGPTVWIDTPTSEVKLHWASERASYPIDFDVRDQIDEIFEEFYNNLKER